MCFLHGMRPRLLIVPNGRCHGMEWVHQVVAKHARPRDNIINDEPLKLEEERGISSTIRNKKGPQTRKLDSGILQATPNREGGTVGVWCERRKKLDKRWSAGLEKLVGELGYDICHLVDVDELDPGL